MEETAIVGVKFERVSRILSGEKEAVRMEVSNAHVADCRSRPGRKNEGRRKVSKEGKPSTEKEWIAEQLKE